MGSLRALAADERGTVTAEFALVVPAVLVILGVVIGSIVIATHRLTLTGAAADIARLEARGDAELAAARLDALGSSVSVAREREGLLLCVTLSSGSRDGLLGVIAVRGSACAAMSEEVRAQ